MHLNNEIELKADLHTHSTCSDGVLSPSDLVDKAYSRGLRVISLTDHDTTEGLTEAKQRSDDLGMVFIPGIEVSCHYSGREHHVLGYSLNPDESSLKEELIKIRQGRERRARIMTQKLGRLGYSVNFDRILEKAGNAPITRPHIADVLLEQGYIENHRQAFTELIGDYGPAYEEKMYFPIENCIKLINKCGGVAVLAHPGGFLEQSTLYKFIKFGLDGIETVHPSHNQLLIKHYQSIARQYWLLETGGSDYHGNREYDNENFGKVTISGNVVESIKMRISDRALF